MTLTALSRSRTKETALPIVYRRRLTVTAPYKAELWGNARYQTDANRPALRTLLHKPVILDPRGLDWFSYPANAAMDVK